MYICHNIIIHLCLLMAKSMYSADFANTLWTLNFVNYPMYNNNWQYFDIKLGFPPSNSIDIHVTDLIFILFLICCTLYTHVSLLCKWFELINVLLLLLLLYNGTIFWHEPIIIGPCFWLFWFRGSKPDICMR